MKVVQIDLFRVTLPFRFSFGHSLAQRGQSTNLLVRARLDDGSEGWGEGIPRDYVTGETVDSAESAIIRRFSPAIIGRQLAGFKDAAETLARQFQELGLESQPMGAAWCALELAILDAVARSLGCPLAAALGPVLNEKLHYDGVVPFCRQKKLVAILLFYRFYGFRTVKVKVGTDLIREKERLTVARRILGDKVTLRVDANCAWTFDQALEASRLFRPLNVASYEQPLPAGDLDGLTRLVKVIPEEVVADESLCTVEQARQLARLRACGGFNIRISKVGGLITARRIAAIGRENGLKVHLGAQVGESGILTAAGRIFGMIEPRLENYEGSDNGFLLQQDLTRENLTVLPGGTGRPLSGCGLGVTVLADRVSRHGHKVHTLLHDRVQIHTDGLRK